METFETSILEIASNILRKRPESEFHFDQIVNAAVLTKGKAEHLYSKVGITYFNH